MVGVPFGSLVCKVNGLGRASVVSLPEASRMVLMMPEKSVPAPPPRANSR